MGDRRWERFGVLGGVVFVVLDVTVAVLGGEPPAVDAGRSEVVSYLAVKGPAIEAGLWLFGLASVALMWWMGSLWRRMVRSEGGAARLAVVSVVGLAVAGALSLASASVSVAAELRVDDVGNEVILFHTLAVMLLAASGFGVAAHVLAASVLGARTHTLPSWVSMIGVASALGFLVSAIVGSTASGDVSELAGVLGFGLWCVWILGVSSVMWSDLRAGTPALTPAL